MSATTVRIRRSVVAAAAVSGTALSLLVAGAPSAHASQGFRVAICPQGNYAAAFQYTSGFRRVSDKVPAHTCRNFDLEGWDQTISVLGYYNTSGKPFRIAQVWVQATKGVDLYPQGTTTRPWLKVS